MSTLLTGFQSFFQGFFFAIFLLAKLATSSIMVRGSRSEFVLLDVKMSQ